jgi:transcriptional regulator with XRE-family HTH domain
MECHDTASYDDSCQGTTHPEYEFFQVRRYFRKNGRLVHVPRRASRPQLPSPASRTTRGLGQSGVREGVIAGYVLKLIRESIGLTQEALAEQLDVDKNTIQGWESGRRSLTGTRVANLVQLRHHLRRLGGDGHLIDALDDAMEADWFLAYALTIEPGEIRPVDHPFASVPYPRFVYGSL